MRILLTLIKLHEMRFIKFYDFNFFAHVKLSHTNKHNTKHTEKRSYDFSWNFSTEEKINKKSSHTKPKHSK